MTSIARRVDRARHLARSDPAAAIAALDALRRDHPGNRRPREALTAIARSDLSRLMPGIARQARAGNWQAALTLLRPLAVADPSNRSLALLAAEGLIATGAPAAALKLADRAGQGAPGNPDLCAIRGDALRLLGDTGAALETLRAGLAVAPDHAGCGVKLGMALLETGDRASAVAAWTETVTRNPGAADCWMNLAPLVDFTAEPDRFAQLSAALDRPGLTGNARECLLFAMAEALLQRGEAARAFATLAEANAMRRRAIGYDPARDVTRFATIRRVFGDAAPLDEAPPAGMPRPILITGLPRSGTTLTERILAAHPLVRALGEIEDLADAVRPHLMIGQPATRGTLAVIADSYRGALGRRAGDNAFVTDKMPLNFRHVGAVLAALPEARVIHLRRDPMAVGFSAYRLRFSGRGNGFAYDLTDLGRYTRMERDLVAFWQDRWPPDRLRILDYASLVERPEDTIRDLLAFCGLPFDPACLAPHLAGGHVLTASAAQVRQPIYGGSDAGWRRYADHLAPLAVALTDPDGGPSPPVAPG